MQQVSARLDLQGLTDVQLAGRIAAGDHDALTLVMRRNNQALYRTARSILKDDTEAEDAVQEAYLHAYRAIAKFHGDSKLSTWLIRIVVNESLGRLRKRNHRAEVISMDGQHEPDEQTLEMNMGESLTERPERAALRGEMRRLLEQKIDQLPDAFRTVFVLRAVEELNVEEAAQCLGIPAATVRTRYFRAKGLLREALAREIDFSLEDAFAFAGARCDRIVAGTLKRLQEIQAGDKRGV
ncbi:MAG: RNA polymerase sigma factor [Stenotrophobium sp.]